jgi:quercetin dioxygenase-like cupin family protein
MRLLRTRDDPKGWLAGPWESQLPIGIGYANQAIDEPHRHARTIEIFLIAEGSVTAVVDGEDVRLHAGDVLIVEPNEARSLRDATSTYRAFVLHVGGDGNDREAATDD